MNGKDVEKNCTSVILFFTMLPNMKLEVKAESTDRTISVSAPTGVTVWYRLKVGDGPWDSEYTNGTSSIVVPADSQVEIILGEHDDNVYDFSMTNEASGVSGSINADHNYESSAPVGTPGTTLDVSNMNDGGSYELTITEHAANTTIRVSYDSDNNLSNGKLQYKATSSSEWTDIGAEGLSADTDAYAIRAVSLVSGYNLGGPSGMRVDGNSELIPGDISSNDGMILNADTRYEFEHICFMRGGNHASAAIGKYRISISNDFEGVTFTGTGITVSFINASGETIGSVTTATSIDETDIPAGTAQIKVDGADDDSTFYCGNARLCKYNETDENFPEVDLIDDIIRNDDFHPGYSITDVDPTSYGYEIMIEFSNKKNVGWTYDVNDPRQDMVVEHCTIQLLDSEGEPMSGDDHNLIIGQEYCFLLVPEYGYQIVGLEVNGYTLAPQDTTGVFKFTMSNSNFHFRGIVAPADDIIETDESGLVAAANISGGENAVDSGNIRMTISDTDTDWNALGAIESEGVVVVGTVDINLDQVTSKGDGNFWSDNITEFEKPVNISLNLSGVEVAEDEEIVVVREHNGVETVLDTYYDAETGIASVDSNQFSSYTIVRVKKGNEPKPDNNGSGNNGSSSGSASTSNATTVQITPVAQTPIEIQVVEAPIDTPVEAPENDVTTDNASPETGESRIPITIYLSGMIVMAVAALMLIRKKER